MRRRCTVTGGAGRGFQSQRIDQPSRLREWMWIPDVLAICGLLGLGAEIAVTFSNEWALEKLPRARARCISWPARFVGLLLAIASLWTGYPIGDDVRVAGVPFVVVILQFERGHWVDYISTFLGPAMIGNAVFAGLLPQVLVFIGRKAVRPLQRRSPNLL